MIIQFSFYQLIYADGAGAVIVEGTNDDSGLISHESASYTEEEVKFLFLGCSFNADSDPNTR